MHVSVLRGRDLSPEHLQAWSDILTANSALESPFFRPDFTMALSHQHDSVFVGVIHDTAASPVAFFPFQLVRPGVGRNLQMCDYQALVAAPGVRINAAQLIRACGLRILEFDHMIASEANFRTFHSHVAESPAMDISLGYDAYKHSLSPEGQRHLAKAATSARKVTREIGPLSLVSNSTDPLLMQTMHQWRARKYGPIPEYCHRTLETIRTANSPAFSGMLSALYAGNTLLAVHFGVRCGSVLHWWFPAYNPEMQQFAPGILLLLRMAEASGALGIAKIDLGKGMQDYKRRFHNSSTWVASGSVDLPTLSNLPRIVRKNCAHWIRQTPVLLRCARQARRVLLSGRRQP